MGLAIDLTLIAINPANGKSLLGSTESDAVYGGAVLLDLVAAERCEVEGAPKKARFRLVSAAPLGDPALDRALSRVKPDRDLKAAWLVPRLGSGSRSLLLQQLMAEEAIAARTERILGVIPLTRYDVLDVARRDALVASVSGVLLGKTEPDAVTGPLISLLWAGNALKRFVEKPDVRAAKRRASDIAKGEWAGAAAKAAIAATSAAVTAAVTAAVVAAASGSGGA